MIHLSELSWDWILKPEAVVQVGTVVRCKVLRTAPEKAKISLSLKVRAASSCLCEVMRDPCLTEIKIGLCQDIAHTVYPAKATTA